MGHPVTQSSPYGSDLHDKKVYADHDYPTFSSSFSSHRPYSPETATLYGLFCCSTINLSDGKDSIIRSSPLSKQLFVFV